MVVEVTLLWIRRSGLDWIQLLLCGGAKKVSMIDRDTLCSTSKEDEDHVMVDSPERDADLHNAFHLVDGIRHGDSY